MGGKKKRKIKGLVVLREFQEGPKGHGANRVDTFARTFIAIEANRVYGVGIISVFLCGGFSLSRIPVVLSIHVPRKSPSGFMVDKMGGFAQTLGLYFFLKFRGACEKNP